MYNYTYTNTNTITSMASNFISSMILSSIESSQKEYSSPETDEKEGEEIEKDENQSKIILIIETLFLTFISLLKFIGPIFFISLFLFILLVASSFFSIILPFYNVSLTVKYLIGSVAVYLFSQIIINYILACIIKPGSVDDIRKSRFYKENDPLVMTTKDVDLYKVFLNTKSNRIIENHPEYERFINKYKPNTVNQNDDSVKEESSVELYDIITDSINDIKTDYSKKELEEDMYFTVKKNKKKQEKEKPGNTINPCQLTSIQQKNKRNQYTIPKELFKYCQTCKEIKPLRSHHCSICGYCVLKMDHHCAWINNCVGVNNHRYFILFLTWMNITCYMIILSIIPIYLSGTDFHIISNKKRVEFKFVVVLSIAGAVILTLFNIWNWYLVLRGWTTIEFWLSTVVLSKNKYSVINDYSLGVRDNFYMVFGTHRVLSALFGLSLSQLPFSGLEWSKIMNYNIKFMKLDVDFIEINDK